ncbi:ABC transporter permease [Fructilactobacillus myrtifloralis]|uniref:ABC transporter permease n=1 Tax=Fructilactobacillus myrtifloralis TaxID=2940301 RepID=A0ABY5BPM8_9LACO|nr:ABC transporter permease [Fructilactobacillus myrtifloralis]USS85592.1 ABC transporter permease [Fructilactobacillus myrtifloralis]
MSFLVKKLFRTVRKNWTQFFSVFLMAFLSVLFYTGLEGTWNGMKQNINHYATQTHLASATLRATAITSRDLHRIRQLPSVKKMNAKTEVETNVNLQGKKRYLTVSTPGKQQISQVRQVDGQRLPQHPRGIYLNQRFAQENGVRVGSFIAVKVNRHEARLKVAGLINAPDKMYYTGSNDFISPQAQAYGYGYVSEETLTNQLHVPTINNVVDLQTKHLVQVEKRLRSLLQDRYVTLQTQKSNIGISTAVDRVGQIRNLSLLFSIIFILLAVLAMYTTIRKVIDQQQQDLSTLQSLGYRNGVLALYYSMYGLLVGTIGAASGLMFAPFLSNFVMNSQKPMFTLPSWKISYTAMPLYIALGVILICMLAAYLAAQVNHGLLPAQAFRKGSTAQVGHRVWLERITKIWQLIPFGNRWSIRANLGNQIQTVMGLVGIIGGLALVMTGFGTKNSMDYQVRQTYGHEYAYTQKINLQQPASATELQRLVNKTNGKPIETITAGLQPHGQFDRPLTILSKHAPVHLQTTDQQQIQNGGVYVTEGIAQRSHLRRNEFVTLHPSLSSKALRLRIKGIVKSNAPQGLYLTQATWEKQGMPFLPSSILTQRSQLSRSVKNSPAVSHFVSLSEQRQNAQTMVDNLGSIFLMIQVFGIMLTIVILYNLGSLSFTERARSYATLEILGFSRGKIRNLTIVETLMITTVGWLVGVPFGEWFLARYVTTFNTNQLIYYPFLTKLSLVGSSLIVIVAAFSTVLLLGRRLRKLDLIAATKGVE